MRKIASAITALAALCGSVFCFTACGDTEAHVHDFSGSWVNTEAGGHYELSSLCLALGIWYMSDGPDWIFPFLLRTHLLRRFGPVLPTKEARNSSQPGVL